MTMNKSLPKILFICHASITSGMGHLLRTSHVAHVALEYADVKIAMLGLHSLATKFQKKMLPLVFIEEEARLLDLVNEWDPDCICFDLLFISTNIFYEISDKRHVVSISPIFNCISEVDAIFHRTKVLPSSWQDLNKPVIHSGLEYTILDERVTKIPTKKYKEIINSKSLPVAISMGGTDAPNKTLSLLNSFRSLPVPMQFWVLLGEGYTHSYSSLVKTLEGSPHEVLLIKSNESMWQILNQCALVFLTGGITTYEASYACLPSINLIENEERFFLLSELCEKNVIDCETGTLNTLYEKAYNALCDFDLNRGKLLKMHLAAKKCGIDLWGADRIIKSIIYNIGASSESCVQS